MNPRKNVRGSRSISVGQCQLKRATFYIQWYKMYLFWKWWGVLFFGWGLIKEGLIFKGKVCQDQSSLQHDICVSDSRVCPSGLMPLYQRQPYEGTGLLLPQKIVAKSPFSRLPVSRSTLKESQGMEPTIAASALP